MILPCGVKGCTEAAAWKARWEAGRYLRGSDYFYESHWRVFERARGSMLDKMNEVKDEGRTPV